MYPQVLPPMIPPVIALKVAKTSANKLKLEAKNQYCWNTDTVMLSCLSFRMVSLSATNMQILATRIQKPVLPLKIWNISHKNGLINITATNISSIKISNTKIYATCEYVHKPNSANVATQLAYPGGEDEILVRKASVM